MYPKFYFRPIFLPNSKKKIKWVGDTNQANLVKPVDAVKLKAGVPDG